MNTRKAFFTFELLASALLLLVVLLVCVNAFSLKARFVFEQEAAKGKLDAILKADSLLKKCAAEGGLAECGVFLHSHEVVESPVEEGGYCVSRIVLFNGEPRVLRKCVG